MLDLRPMGEHGDTSRLLRDLAAIVGSSHVLAQGDLRAWTTDWRHRYHGRALAIVQPAHPAEVAAVVRACATQNVAIVPQGGNTGLVGAGVPDQSGTQILLSLRRLQRIRNIDIANATLTVEAGLILKSVQDEAARHGLLFPLSLAAEGSCTIGGNLATNAGGTQVLRYGNARDLCLGLEVVTSQGQIWSELSGLRKNNTGYDLRHLFIGSEGTLGIITAATLKLFPAPQAQHTALVACPDMDACVALLQWTRCHLGDELTGFEVMDEASRKMVAQHCPQLMPALPLTAPWIVLIEISCAGASAPSLVTFEDVLAQALERHLISDAVVAQSAQQSQSFWRLRESIALAQSMEGPSIKHDIALPVSSIPTFIAQMGSVLQATEPGARPVAFGHLGDGNLHYNVHAPQGSNAELFLQTRETALQQRVHDAVLALNGSISAEHGIGIYKSAELSRLKSPTALSLMRAIKTALDPQGIFNPGCLFSPPDSALPHGMSVSSRSPSNGDLL